MGRTNPTFRDYLRRFEEDWQPFRRALRQQYQGDFDELLEKAEHFADAAGFQNATDPEKAILVAMLLHHEGDLDDLEAQLQDVDEFEARLAELEAAVFDGDPGTA